MSQRLRARLGALATMTAVVSLLIMAPSASAHVEVSPSSAPPSAFTTFTLTVPNERPGEDTVGLDVTLPRGFTLEDAQSLPGWRTVVDTRADGLPVAMHWLGGHIPPHTFAVFAFRGRTSNKSGTLEFPAVQHYESGTVTWIGPADSDQPAPRLVVRAQRGGGTGAQTSRAAPLATVPVVSAGSGTGSNAADGDMLARSRAALALALATCALALVVGYIAVIRLTSRSRERS